MIVKVMKPLSRNVNVLVCSEDRRTIFQTIPMDDLPATISAALGDRVRVFWHATVEDSGTLVFGAAAPTQGW